MYLMMMRFKKTLFIVCLILLPFILIQLPFVQSVIFNVVSRSVHEKHGINLKAEDIGGVWPLSFHAKQLSIVLKNQDAIIVSEIDCFLDKTQLLKGKISLSSLKIDKADITLNPTKFDPQSLFETIHQIFSFLDSNILTKAQINHLKIQNCEFSILSKKGRDAFSFIIKPLNGNEELTLKLFAKNNLKVIDFSYDAHNCFIEYMKSLVGKHPIMEALRHVSGSLYINDFISGNLEAKFDEGSISSDFIWNSTQGLKLNLQNSQKLLEIPEFGVLKTLRFDGIIDQKFSIRDFNLETEDLRLSLQGNMNFSKPLDELDPNLFYNDLLQAKLDFVIRGDLLEDYLDIEEITSTLEATHSDKGLNVSLLLPDGLLSGNILKDFFRPKTKIDILYKAPLLKASIPLLWGDNLTIQATPESVVAHFKKHNKNSLFDTSTIKADFKQGKWLIKGNLKPIGDNHTSVNLVLDQGHISGKVAVSLNDLAPLTTPFDFATVGKLKGDIIFKHFSFLDQTGSVSFDLTSPFFRSPLFKTEQVSFKGVHKHSTDLKLDVNTLAIGKAFLAEKSFVSLKGDSKGYDLEISSKSHKIGYLSSKLQIDVKAKLNPSKHEMTVNTFNIEHLKQKVKLEKPVIITPRKIENAALLVNDGRINFNNIAFNKLWKGDIELKAIPIGILNWFLYKTVLVGTLNGTITLFGAKTLPDYKADLKATKVQWGQLNAFSEGVGSPLDLSVYLVKQNDNFSVNSTLQGKNVADLKVEWQTSPQKGHLKGYLDLSLISAIVASGDRLSGRITGDLSFMGTNLNGYLKTDNSYVELAEFGTVINKIKGTLKASGSRLIIESLKATDDPLYSNQHTAKKGDLDLSGFIDFKNPFKPNVNLTLVLKDFLLVNSDSIRGSADGVLKIKGEGIYSLITGFADIHALDIDIDALETDDDIPMIKVQDPKKRTYAKNYQKEHFSTQEKRVILPMDLVLKTNQKLSVHGSIVSESMWGGDMKVKGPIDEPSLEGTVTLLSGTLDFFGQNLKVEKGEVNFVLDKKNQAQLKMQATKTVNDTALKVIIDTSRDVPIDFQSSPAYPKDEILSFILFGKTAGTVSAGQSIQLASALAKLNGKKGFNLMDDLRKGFGIDTFEIREQVNSNVVAANAPGTQAVRIGKKITEHTEVSVEQGGGGSRLGLEMEITDNLSLEVDIGAQRGSNPSNAPSGSGAGVVWSKRY